MAYAFFRDVPGARHQPLKDKFGVVPGLFSVYPPRPLLALFLGEGGANGQAGGRVRRLPGIVNSPSVSRFPARRRTPVQATGFTVGIQEPGYPPNRRGRETLLRARGLI